MSQSSARTTEKVPEAPNQDSTGADVTVSAIRPFFPCGDKLFVLSKFFMLNIFCAWHLFLLA